MSTVIANISFFGLVEGKSYTVVDTDSKCYRVVLNEDTGFAGWVGKSYFEGAIIINNITATTPITFNQFYTLLVNHDWFYEYSDSMAVQSEQRSNESTLISIAKRHAFSYYMFHSFTQRRNESIVGINTDERDTQEMYDDFIMTQEANL